MDKNHLAPEYLRLLCLVEFLYLFIRRACSNLSKLGRHGLHQELEDFSAQAPIDQVGVTTPAAQRARDLAASAGWIKLCDNSGDDALDFGAWNVVLGEGDEEDGKAALSVFVAEQRSNWSLEGFARRDYRCCVAVKRVAIDFAHVPHFHAAGL